VRILPIEVILVELVINHILQIHLL